MLSAVCLAVIELKHRVFNQGWACVVSVMVVELICWRAIVRIVVVSCVAASCGDAVGLMKFLLVCLRCCLSLAQQVVAQFQPVRVVAVEVMGVHLK